MRSVNAIYNLCTVANKRGLIAGEADTDVIEAKLSALVKELVFSQQGSEVEEAEEVEEKRGIQWLLEGDANDTEWK